MISTTGAVVIIQKDELAALIAAAADAAIERYVKAHPTHNKPRPASVNQTTAAEMLGKSPATIRKMERAGVFKLNGIGQIPIEQIDAVLRGG